MKKRYLDLMEKALSAYPYEHIQRYFDDVKEHGLTEHGFPRLTANIGILISHGRRRDLLPIFLEMMKFCCKTIPNVKAANDFSVREMICCIWEVERSGVADAESLARWRGYLRAIDPLTCYTRVATSMDYNYRNWVLFTAVSEFFRSLDGLCRDDAFLEFQLRHQLQFFDENGMYLDNKKTNDRHHPIVYDLVPRGLLSILLEKGYRGEHYQTIDAILKKSALLTLDMQSPTGEIAYGGRSNQFVHNEAWLVGICEYEAKRYMREGNLLLASRFAAARERAIAVMEEWLNKDPIRHIKNRYPTDTGYGCEDYAYFDKYMITVASLLYVAYQICDDSLTAEALPDTEPTVCMTSSRFHKLFLKCGGYGLEFDTDADPHYDAKGLGRVHRAGAPSPICMSVPATKTPSYRVDREERYDLSLCPAIKGNGEWIFATEEGVGHAVTATSRTNVDTKATLRYDFFGEKAVTADYRVNSDGVEIRVWGEGEIAHALPAFAFDGESKPEITATEHTLTVAYQGWICRYTTDGSIRDTGKIACNRNGHYRAFLTHGQGQLTVNIEILPIEQSAEG
ncbi:MAG: hypothetical protein IJX28_01340 [Clostridia bacterium]|nr:hypothetical protein [Clostridia bacterium]